MRNMTALVLLLVTTTAVPAQKPLVKTRFGSVYSNLTTNCKNFAGSNGSDGYSICSGPGGYQIRNYYAAAAALYVVELKGGEASYPLPMLDLGFDDRKTIVEWRTADGKPFAVIMRIPTYAKARDEKEYFGLVNGERLVIRGLKGIDLDMSIDGRLPGANKTAREIADTAYLRRTRN